ncbi:MAG: hypothetical protein ACREJ9_09800 [Candidatus Rokuibacteriota bacterium]
MQALGLEENRMVPDRRTSMADRKPRIAQGRTPRSTDAGSVQRAIQTTMSSGEAISVGVVNLVRSTLVAAVSGVQDVGKEVGATAVAAVRGSIRAMNEIGGDLVTVAEHAVKATMGAAGEIAHEVTAGGGSKPASAITTRGRRPLAKASARKIRSAPSHAAKRRSA